MSIQSELQIKKPGLQQDQSPVLCNSMADELVAHRLFFNSKLLF